MVTTTDLLPTANKAAEICNIAPEHIFLFGEDDAGKISYRSVFAKRLATPVKIDMEDVAYLCYSSGTTGMSENIEQKRKKKYRSITLTEFPWAPFCLLF